MVSTSKLLGQIRQSARQEFIDSDNYTGEPLCAYLNQILHKKNEKSVRSAIDKLLLDVSYGYQIFNGNRKPTRNILLRFALIYHLDLTQTQRLLNLGQKSMLYPRNRFDAAVIYAIEHGYDFEQTEDLLQEIGEKPLC